MGDASIPTRATQVFPMSGSSTRATQASPHQVHTAPAPTTWNTGVVPMKFVAFVAFVAVVSLRERVRNEGRTSG
jgi:hypothetical protein